MFIRLATDLSGRLDSLKEGEIETAVHDEDAEGQAQDGAPDVADPVALLDLEHRQTGKGVTNSVTRKKSPNVYKTCPKMISLEK